jgi:hypothetical protein
MRPNVADFDVPDHFSAGAARGEDDTRVGLLCTLEVSFKLRKGQRILEKACTPLNEISLAREPRDQAREVLATKGMERYAICWWPLSVISLSNGNWRSRSHRRYPAGKP